MAHGLWQTCVQSDRRGAMGGAETFHQFDKMTIRQDVFC
jgi:hypothetical protein